MVRNRPIVLDNGDYLLPVYHETGHDTEVVGADSTSLFLRYRRDQDSGADRRHPLGEGEHPAGRGPARDQDLIAYCRRGGDYSPKTIGYIVRSESHDGGWTWSEGKDSTFPNPNAAVDFLKLESGRLLLVFNDSMTAHPAHRRAFARRRPTYPRRRNLGEGPGDFAYPIAFQAADGRIHVVYTSDRRTVVNHAVFTESWLLGGAAR